MTLLQFSTNEHVKAQRDQVSHKIHRNGFCEKLTLGVKFPFFALFDGAKYVECYKSNILIKLHMFRLFSPLEICPMLGLENLNNNFTIHFCCLFVKSCRVSFGIEQSFLADVGITHQLTRSKFQLLYQEEKCLCKAH